MSAAPAIDPQQVEATLLELLSYESPQADMDRVRGFVREVARPHLPTDMFDEVRIDDSGNLLARRQGPAGTRPLLIFAYGGYEVTGVLAGEAANPKRDVPFAFVMTLLIVATVMTLASITATGLLPNLSDSRTPIADGAALILGATGAFIVSLGSSLSMAGNNMGQILNGSRSLFALAENGDLPRWFARVHPDYRTPENAILFTAVVALALAACGDDDDDGGDDGDVEYGAAGFKTLEIAEGDPIKIGISTILTGDLAALGLPIQAAAELAGEGVEIERILADYASVIGYVRGLKRSNKRVYLAFDEWNVWYRARHGEHTRGAWSEAPPLLEEVYNLEDALVCAQYLTAFLRHADLVKVACLAQIVNVIGQPGLGEPAQVRSPPGRE